MPLLRSISRRFPARAVLLIALTGLACAGTVLAQDVIPFDTTRWDINARSHLVMDYQGQEALMIKGGSAVLKGASFVDGVVEFDIAFSQARNFTGVRWRMQNDRSNYEEFYFRPHLNDMPDANQYTPVFNGNSAWQLYHGAPYSVPVRYKYNDWMHVKLVFAGGRASIHVDSDEPVLAMDLKMEPTAGTLAVYAGNLAPAYFANFRFSEGPVVPGGVPEQAPAAEPGTVMAWSVSSPFGEDMLDNLVQLGPELKRGLTWTMLNAESTGITNLSRLSPVGEGSNTVFVRSTLTAEEAGVRRVRFGYSDRVRLFVNDRLVYAGTNAYVSRDYRYLGTIGLFDEIAVPVRAGANEIWFAVSEDFGGWGIIAQVVE